MKKNPSTPSTSAQIFSFLKEHIASGEWAPGSKLPSEASLCSQLGVSRVSVRAAINQLIGLGLVESLQGKGTFVRKISLEDSMDSIYPTVVLSKADRLSIYEFRTMFEVACVKYAALRATTHVVDDLYRINLNMNEASEVTEIAKWDLEFHGLIVRATGNALFIRIFDVFHDTYLKMFEENVSKVGKYGVPGHLRIIAAIEARNAEAAQRAMTEHLNSLATQML